MDGISHPAKMSEFSDRIVTRILLNPTQTDGEIA
jgi:hypothetical protein